MAPEPPPVGHHRGTGGEAGRACQLKRVENVEVSADSSGETIFVERREDPTPRPVNPKMVATISEETKFQCEASTTDMPALSITHRPAPTALTHTQCRSQCPPPPPSSVPQSAAGAFQQDNPKLKCLRGGEISVL
jgi:hypothetical protein